MKKLSCICVGNSIRSQIAEAYFNHEFPGNLKVNSGGLVRSAVHPLVFQVLREEHIFLEDPQSQAIEELSPNTDYLWVLAQEALEHARGYFKVKERLDFWDIPDPARLISAGDPIDSFRRVRDMIRKRVRNFSF